MLSLTIISLFAWLNNSSEACVATPVTNTTPCRACDGGLIDVTQRGPGAWPMAGDDIDRMTGACATRTFTCTAPAANNPNIELNNGNGVVQDEDNGAIDGVTTLTVTCNTAGNAWLFMDVPIVQVECAAAL